LTFFNVDPATVMSKWVGEAEQLVKQLFQLAEEMGPSTIFFILPSLFLFRSLYRERSPSTFHLSRLSILN
jgi:AAA+ superfamily predicted ATPase